MVGRIAQLLVLASALLAAAVAQAQVDVRVDRSRVELNESFTLEVSIDASSDSEPDVSALNEDFFVSQARRMSNTTIVNGQIQRSSSWTYSLMAKRAGLLEIPSISVGSETSQPLSITVVEPTYEPPGEADVFITSEIDTSETYVQAQVIYRIKIYRAVATRQPTLRRPSFNGAEVLIELAGEEKNYEAILNGRAYGVNEHVYALFPQESGTIEISPARFEARVLRNGRITGRKVFSSDAHTIDVKPIPPLPAEYPDAHWLPARDVSLSESWSDSPDELKAGEPVTRNVTISAVGQLETQIPVIEPPESPNVNMYTDKPELSREYEPDGIRGVREDQYALIGVRAGTVSLPELTLPWFDLDTGEWAVARLPGRDITILPADDALNVAPEEPQPDTAAAADTQPEVRYVESPFWQRLAQFLGAAWAVTLLAWWWTSRPTREQRVPEAPPLHKQQARLLKDARTAARAGDAAQLRRLLLDWARNEWPDNAPRSIGELALRVADPLSTELLALSRSAYGPGEPAWDGDAMARAIRSLRIRKQGRDSADEQVLPPLMPSQ